MIKQPWFLEYDSCSNISEDEALFANEYHNSVSFFEDFRLTFGDDYLFKNRISQLDGIKLLMKAKSKDCANLPAPQKQLVDRVRRDLGPHGIKLTDEDIINHWQGSLDLHRLELAYAWMELKREIKKAIPQKIRRLLGLQL